MAIAQRAVGRTALHAVVALAAIGRTRPHIHLVPIPVQVTAVAVPVLVVADLVGHLQVRRSCTRLLR